MSTEDRRIQLVAEVDTTRTRAGFNEIAQQGEGMAAQVTRSGEQAQRAVSNIGSGAGRSAQSVEAAQRNIIGSIQRTTAAMQAGTRSGAEYYEVLARQRGVDPAVLAPYLAQLRAVEAAQQQAGMSTRAYSAAMRNVPAQITDIVTSLQGGMPALTVALQQGGQLRDMFGGIVPAARALSTQLLSMITPYTLVGAALAAVGIAYYQGSKESDAFRLSIVSTGNAAGVTTSQLAGMAKQASEVIGTQGANAAALAALVGTGKVAADQLVAASVAAVSAQKFLGIAVDSTVKSYADLGGDPLKATLKLNEQYGYLTMSTYKQVRALEEQGQKSDAAKVAQAAYADMLRERSKKIEDSLGSLERSWNFVGSAAKGAWDLMLNIGREDTLEEKITRAQANLQKAKAAYLSFIGTKAEKDADRDEAQRQLDRLLNIKKVGELSAQYEAEDSRRRDAAIKFDQQEEQFLSRRAKMERDIVQARALGEQSAARGEDPSVTEERIQKRIAQIRASYADINNAGVESQIAAVTRLGAIQEEGAKRARLILETEQQSAGAQALDKRVEYAEKAAKLDEEALQREKARIQQRLALTAREAVSEDQRGAQQQKLADMRGQIALVDEQILTRRAQLSKDITAMDVADTAAAIESHERLLAARQADVDALRGQLQAQKTENATLGMTSKQLQAYNTQRVEEIANIKLSEAARLGAIPGREAEAEAIRKSVELMRELNLERGIGATKKESIEQWEDAVKKYDDIFRQGFADMLNNGKSGWDSFTKSLTTTFKTSVADEIYKMFAKPFVVNMVGNLMGVTGSGSSSVAGAVGMADTGSSALNLVSMGQKIYQGFTTGFSTVGTTLGGYVATLGNMFGSASVSAFGAGMGMTSAQAANAAAAYNAAGMTGTGSAISAGSTAGAAAGVFAGAAGGVFGGRLISGGYSAFGGSGNSAVNTGTAVGAAVGSIIPVVGTALGALIGGLIGGATNRLFGHKAPTIDSQGVRGTIDANGINAETYANIVAKGGVFRSDKWSYEHAALDATTDKSLDTTLVSMISAVTGFGKALGIETNAITGYTKSFDLKLTGNAEQDDKLVLGLLDTVSNELAERLVPGLSRFAAEGETLSATLQRVTADYVAVDTMLNAIGQTARVTGAAGIEARERLIAAAGGLEVLASGASFFQQNYLTQAEQIAPVQKQVTEQLAALGLSSVKTSDQFKAAVLGIDVSTEAGAKLFAQMMALGPAFKQVADYTESLKTKSDELKAAAIEKATTNLKSAYDAETSARANTIASLTSAIESYKKFSDGLVLGSLSTLTPLQKLAQAQQQYENTLAAAKAGDTAAQANLATAANTYLTADQVVKASSDAYAADFAKVQADMAAVAAAAVGQLSDAQKQQASLDALVKGWISIDDSIKAGTTSVVDAIAALELAGGTRVDGSHANGLVSTPYNGYIAELHAGEPVIDAPAAAALRRYFGGTGPSGGANTSALVAEIKALRAEVAGLRADQEKQTGAIVSSTYEAAEINADKTNEGAKVAAKEGAYVANNPTWKEPA